jgi:hypothetical protein
MKNSPNFYQFFTEATDFFNFEFPGGRIKITGKSKFKDEVNFYGYFSTYGYELFLPRYGKNYKFFLRHLSPDIYFQFDLKDRSKALLDFRLPPDTSGVEFIAKDKDQDYYNASNLKDSEKDFLIGTALRKGKDDAFITLADNMETLILGLYSNKYNS